MASVGGEASPELVAVGVDALEPGLAVACPIGELRVDPAFGAVHAGAWVLDEAGNRFRTSLAGFATGSAETPGRSNVLTTLKNFEKKLGLREWSFHVLRHFFISALVRHGASIEVVRLLAGHSKLDVTQRYVHAEAGELRSAMALLRVTGG